MGPKGTLRAVEATQRRHLREAQRQQRELERRNKEQAKLSAQEKARLEVETFENVLDVLLSVHKEQGQTWDWIQIAASLPPVRPERRSYLELRTLQTVSVWPGGKINAYLEIEEARSKDQQNFEAELQEYAAGVAEWKRLQNLAERILARDHKAYIEALVEYSPLRELSSLGSMLHFTIHNDEIIECRVSVNGAQAIPTDVKTLTSAGKVSIKSMPKTRFHEIYQDYVCGCMLRVAREVFAMLPMEVLLISALAELVDTRTGRSDEKPVLSAVVPRKALENLDFDRLDPSDAIDSFQRRGDFKASRKSGAFQPIVPLTVGEINHYVRKDVSLQDLQVAVRKMRGDLRTTIELLKKRNQSLEPRI